MTLFRVTKPAARVRRPNCARPASEHARWRSPGNCLPNAPVRRGTVLAVACATRHVTAQDLRRQNRAAESRAVLVVAACRVRGFADRRSADRACPGARRRPSRRRQIRSRLRRRRRPATSAGELARVGRPESRLQVDIDGPRVGVARGRSEAACGRVRSARATRASRSRATRSTRCIARAGRKSSVALDASTGKTSWEYAYDSPFDVDVGPGPYAMPQVLGDRIVTVGSTGKLHSIDKKTGKPVWSHDLYDEYGGSRMRFGYSCHALPYKDLIILMVGGSRSAHHGVQAERRRRRLGQAPLQQLALVTAPDQRRRPGSGRRADGAAGRRRRAQLRRAVVGAVAPDAVRPCREHAVVGSRQHPRSCRRRTKAARGRCISRRGAGRPRSSSCGGTRVCACISAR